MGKLAVPRLVYTGLRVRDIDRSIAFYREALGMELQFKFKIKETGGRVAYLVSPGGTQKLELNWYPGAFPLRKGDELDHLGFKTGDLRDTHARLLARGAHVTIPTFREGSSLLTFYEDPDGIPIEVQSTLAGRFRVRGRGRPKPKRSPGPLGAGRRRRRKN